MIIGFTGTQSGMTAAQRATVKSWLVNLSAEELHHGDCIGADAEAHEIAISLGYRTVLHPPTNRSKRAFCTADVERAPMPYLDRNQEIAVEAEVLIAAPSHDEEVMRSGTWATIRRARKLQRPIIIVYPDGSFSKESYTTESQRWFANAVSQALIERGVK